MRTPIAACLVAVCGALLAARARAAEPATTRASTAPAGALTFEQEIQASQPAPDRDSRVEHLRRALSLRPEHPQNIVLEFKIATMIGQNNDPVHNQPARPLDSLPLLEAIVERYDHKNYYRSDFMGTGSDSPDLMVPRAAILAASIKTGALGDTQKARELLIRAMKDLQWTFEKRKADWTNAPKPQASLFDETGLEKAKFEGRIRYWERHKRDAAEGKVFGGLEPAIVEAAVRQFAYTFGNRPDNVAGAMELILRDFPGTPMAVAAQQKLDQLGLGAGVTPRTAVANPPRTMATTQQSSPATHPPVVVARANEHRWLTIACFGTAVACAVLAALLFYRRKVRRAR